MSLNGLDDLKVKEAHETAVTETGGWFLLKYASRDGVELLGRGNGGIVEIRNSIAQYEEPSPLYGLLRYRRRTVIIKYLPDDCSRLAQARATVHFSSVCDRFSPYDTTFSITTSKELKDTKLSSACSLHTASGSTSSSTSSLRRRRLMEITEEEEEEEREKKRQSTVKEEERPKTPDGHDGATFPPVTSPSSHPPVTLNSDLATSPEASRFATTAEPPAFTGVPRPGSPANSLDDTTRRKSSHPSSRPDLYSYSSYTYGRPKVKLGPRPSLDVGGRPRTSGSADAFRPVATMPTGLKLSKGSRKSKAHDKALGQEESSAIEEEAVDTADNAVSSGAAPEHGPELLRPHTSGGALPSLSSSVATGAARPPVPSPTPKQNIMTPEKARLMKAKKLREMKKKMSVQTSDALPVIEIPSSPATAQLSEATADPTTAETITVQEELEVRGDDGVAISKADSGVAIDPSNDQVSVATRSDSHPASPVASASDLGDSTQASSLSESTEETLRPHNELKDLHSEADSDEDDETEDASVADRTSNEIEDCATEIQRTESQASPEVIDEAEVSAGEEVAQSELVESEQGQSPIQRPVTPVCVPAAAAAPAEASGEDTTMSTDLLNSPSPEDPARTLKGEAANEDSAEVLTDEAVDGTTSDTPPFQIPVSKFSTQEVKSPSNASPGPIPFVVAPLPDPEHEFATRENKSTREADIEDAETASIETRRSKRKTLVEPIHTDFDRIAKHETAHSEANLSDDDDLMDELQSATVQQAQPIMVSKSPIMPVFPNLSATDIESGAAMSLPLRAVSNPIRGPLLTPSGGSSNSARVVSSGAAFLHKITQQPTSAELRPKPAKIGSSISQRIKALEMRSSLVAGDSAHKERPSSTFFSVRKSSIREPSRPPSLAERADSIRHASPSQSRESSPETARPTRGERSGSLANRLSVFEGGSVPRGRPESVQVTARIVRDPTQPFPKVPELKPDAADFGLLELRQSPLVVDHRTSSQMVRPSTTPAPTQSEEEHQIGRRPSLLRRTFSKGRRSQSQDLVAEGTDNVLKDEIVPVNCPRRRRSSLTIVRDFIKDRRDSLLSGRPSTDNLHLTLSPSSGNLATPAITSPSRSPSRPPSVHQNSMFTHRLSISSRRSSTDQKSPPLPAGPLSPSLMTEASDESDGDENKRSRPGSSVVPTSPNPGGKSANRASRFIRRLSNSLSSTRKNVTPSISPTVAEEDDGDIAAQNGGRVVPSKGSAAAGYAPPSIVAYLGDVNVQFPDNLLWKRRTMCLDNQGFLILSTVQGVPSAIAPAATGTGGDRQLQAGAIKRYHLSDFRPPYTPEMELQELPNSVVLDFVDGSGLQVACEDRAGQMNVLNILQDAHRNHTSFGQ